MVMIKARFVLKVTTLYYYKFKSTSTTLHIADIVLKDKSTVTINNEQNRNSTRTEDD